LSDAVTISSFGPYVVTISSADAANSLTFNNAQAALFENAGSLTMSGALTMDAGFVSLNEANTIGSVTVAGGTLAFGNGGALGAGTITLSGGELLASANETLTNALSFSGSSTIAAAHGTTLAENASSINIAASSTLNFGALGEDGTILWHTPGSINFGSPLPVINVQAGTLKGADNLFGFFLEEEAVTVAAGATLDLAGNNTDLVNLTGGGSVIDSGAADILTLAAANFSGVISGAQSLIASGTTTLSGDNTYTGTTTIGSGVGFELGLGGTTGSIGGGAIVDDGTLYIFRSNAITLTNAISGSGILRLVGSGVTSINSANTYSGGTLLQAGTLAIGNGAALGTGAVSLSGGELLATASENLTNALSFSNTSTIAASHGATLNENASSMSIASGSTLNFGAPGQDGTILWHTPGSINFGADLPAINVQAGTLKGVDNLFGFFLEDEAVAVAVGATLDLAGNSTDIIDLSGGGSVIDSGAADTLSLNSANFSGVIAGAQSLSFVGGNSSLSGLEDYTGGATIEAATTVANSGTYDIVSNNGIAGTPGSLFVNTGLFEKTGGGGVSDVTSNFINSGTLDVLSGSIQFTGGFANNGVIHGLVTQSGGVTTISAPVQDDFNGDAMSDILWRNTNGDALIWNSNGSGGFSSRDLGIVDNGYQVAGTGDFNGDGVADILWRNTSNGDTVLWSSNGSGGFSTEDLGTIPTGYQVAGTGDFNGVGEEGILWRNTSNGDTLLWNSNGSGGFTTQDLGTVSTGYQIAGTGDFAGNGEAGVLWRNTSNGDALLWESNGSGGFTTQDLGIVSTGYQVAGTGDFNGDGKADILWRNTSNGDTLLWDSNGSGGFTTQDLGVVSTGYQVAGTGDFNGDGKADILWRNTSNGDTLLWDSNGSGGFSTHDLGAVSTSYKIAAA
jgi:autotransporter-associated beta strand protein